MILTERVRPKGGPAAICREERRRFCPEKTVRDVPLNMLLIRSLFMWDDMLNEVLNFSLIRSIIPIAKKSKHQPRILYRLPNVPADIWTNKPKITRKPGENLNIRVIKARDGRAEWESQTKME